MSHGQNFGHLSVNCSGLVRGCFVYFTLCILVLEMANFLMIERLFPIILNRLNMASIFGPRGCVFEM